MSLFLIFSVKPSPRVSDPHHFNADPDPAFHFNADPDLVFHVNVDPDLDPDPHQGDANLRPLVYRPSRPSFGLRTLQAFIWSTEPPGLHLVSKPSRPSFGFQTLQAFIWSTDPLGLHLVYRPSRPSFVLQTLQAFIWSTDPPGLHFSLESSRILIFMRIRSQLFTVMRIRIQIQLPNETLPSPVKIMLLTLNSVAVSRMVTLRPLIRQSSETTF